MESPLPFANEHVEMTRRFFLRATAAGAAGVSRPLAWSQEQQENDTTERSGDAESADQGEEGGRFGDWGQMERMADDTRDDVVGASVEDAEQVMRAIGADREGHGITGVESREVGRADVGAQLGPLIARGEQWQGLRGQKRVQEMPEHGLALPGSRAKGELGTPGGAAEVGGHRNRGALRVGEEQCGPPGGDHPSVGGRACLQARR